MHGADLAHSLFTFLLLLEQLALAGHVAAVALGRNVLAHLLHGLAGDYLRPDCRLHRNVELLPRDEVLEFHAHLPSEFVSVILVDEGGKRIRRLAVEQNVKAHQFGRAVILDVIVERRITLGDGLELVVEIEHDLGQRHIVGELHALGGDVMLAYQRAAAIYAEFHYWAEELRLGDDLSAYVRLLDVVDQGRGRKPGRVVHVDHVALGRVHFVGNVRHGGDHVHVEFTEQTLLHDLEMQQSQESATEP